MSLAREQAVLEARSVSVAFGGAAVLRDISTVVPKGRIVALIGPNGSGKSTLLRALSRLIEPHWGAVLLDGTSISRLSSREVARQMALLPQGAEVPEGITVEELVSYGRYPHRGPLRRLRTQDHDAITWALASTGLEAYRRRLVDSLSGGERQRAWVAMALAQRTGLLLLDEPTTYLDLRHQLEILRLIRELNRDHGLTVVWVLHDLNQAMAFSDLVTIMASGQIVGHGAAQEVLTPDTVRRVFGIDAIILPHPNTGHPVLIPAEPA